MPVVVHLKNGQTADLRFAESCSWRPASTPPSRNDVAPRWLVCRNGRGDVIATYKEPDIMGYQPQQQMRGFNFPLWRGKKNH